jgi:hypothetical protein
VLRCNHTFYDNTGAFPVTSRRGNKYVMVSIRSNIHVVPMPSKTGGTQAKTHAAVNDFWTRHGLKPVLARFDNETSKELEEYYHASGIPIQYFPPSNHHANVAEKAIQTFKTHFIATIATCDPEFTIVDGDLLLDQAELTLNLLRFSTVEPTKSAWEHVHGPYDFDAHPFAPAGCKVVMHERSEVRGTWAQHGVVGFYIGPASNHYRSFHAWIPQTHKQRVSDTVAWFPHNFTMPGSSVLEHVEATSRDLEQSILALSTAPGLQQIQQPLGLLATQLTANLRALTDLYQSAVTPATEAPQAIAYHGPYDPNGPMQSPARAPPEPEPPTHDAYEPPDAEARPQHATEAQPNPPAWARSQQQRVAEPPQQQRVQNSPQQMRVPETSPQQRVRTPPH